MPRHAAVFLDRDNTIIVNDGDLGDPDEVQLIQGAAAAIGSLRGLGYKIIVVTNQGGVARGHYTEKDVDAVHARINEIIRKTASGAFVDRFYYCPFHPKGTVEKYRKEHPWRKPQPGMLEQAAKDLGLDLEQCWMIGDQRRDVAAGNAVGSRTILLDARQMHSVMKENPTAEGEGPNFVARSLVEAVRFVAQSRRPEMAEEIRTDEPGSTQWNDAAAAAIRQREHAEPVESGSKQVISPYRNRPAESKKPFRPIALPDEEEQEDENPTDFEPKIEISEQLKTPEPAVPASERRVVEPVPLGPSPDHHELQPPVHDEPDVRHEPPAPPPAEPEPVHESPEPVRLPPEHEPEPVPEASPPPRRRRQRVIPTETLLRQILHELKTQNQRSTMKDWSTLGYVAIVLQLVAGLCLLAGLLMGREQDMVFMKWLGTGILMQLAVIAILLFDR